MITNPDRPGMYLIELARADLDDPGLLTPEARSALRTIRDWVGDYLCRPLADLGRRGAVCPYTQTSLDRNLMYAAVRPGRPADVTEIVAEMAPYREWFLQLAPSGEPSSIYTTIMVLFPDLERADLPLIDKAQAVLKDEYVADGLMIGEFHHGPPDKGGLHNPDLRPLASPVPMLVIRNMVATDLPFLRNDRDHLRAYLNRFEDKVPAHLRETVRAARAELA